MLSAKAYKELIDVFHRHKLTHEIYFMLACLSISYGINNLLSELNNEGTKHVLVIGATTDPDTLDRGLRTQGHFDREIPIGIPDTDARKK